MKLGYLELPCWIITFGGFLSLLIAGAHNLAPALNIARIDFPGSISILFYFEGVCTLVDGQTENCSGLSFSVNDVDLSILPSQINNVFTDARWILRVAFILYIIAAFISLFMILRRIYFCKKLFAPRPWTSTLAFLSIFCVFSYASLVTISSVWGVHVINHYGTDLDIQASVGRLSMAFTWIGFVCAVGGSITHLKPQKTFEDLKISAKKYLISLTTQRRASTCSNCF